MNTRKQFPAEHSRARVSRGFTLIELVVAMVIAAVLAAIAIPSYSNYVRKGRRTDAKSALLDMASLEERYFTTNNVYSQNPADLGYPGYPVGGPIPVGNYYQVTIPAADFLAATVPSATSLAGTPASYWLVATPVGDQVNDTACTSFTVTSAGVQSSTPAGGSCW
jgi:type IV pilus assembly protein PilE